MTPKIDDISPAEWEVMRIVWTKGEVSSHDLISLLQQKRDWSDSTIKTLIGRLVKKALLQTTKDGRRFLYSATVAEGTAMDSNVQAMFANLCAMKRGQTLVNLIKELPLAQADIKALQAVLADKAKTAPEMVPCDCLPDETQCETCEVNDHE